MLKIFVFITSMVAVAKADVSFPRGTVLGYQPSRDLDLRGVGFALGDSGSEVKVRCERIRVEAQAIHGVRIGILPQVVVEGMEWEVNGGKEWVVSVEEFFRQENLLRGARFEKFRLRVPSEQLELEAKEVVFGQGTRHAEMKEVVVSIGGDFFCLPKARLGLSGDAAGCLVLPEPYPSMIGLTPIPVSAHYQLMPWRCFPKPTTAPLNQ